MIRLLFVLVASCSCGTALAAKAAQDLHLTHSWRVALDASGAVTQLESIDTLDPAVAAPLERAISGWSFEPGRIDGVAAPTETTLTLDLRFVPADGDRYAIRIDDARTGGRVDAESSRRHFPRFPNQALKRGLFAMIVVKVDYDASGTVVAVEPQSELGLNASSSLEKATVAAVRQWAIQPERVGGRAVASSLMLPVCYSVVAASQAPPDYACAFKPAGSNSPIGEGDALALAPVARLRSDVVGRAL
ncbi:MAG: hypothetical protein EOP90_09140 [Lysobacteraceae bacterium]|nr:MAG: hypothetical protein EOP90_09140 [Xanthomonadaceae bacterium]